MRYVVCVLLNFNYGMMLTFYHWRSWYFLGLFTEVHKGITSFVISIHPCGTIWLQLDRFLCIPLLGSVRGILFWLKVDKNTWQFT